MELNTLLFNSVKPKISHSSVGQSQVASMYVERSTPISMTSKNRKHFIKLVFFHSQFTKYCKSGKSPKALDPSLGLDKINNQERHLKQHLSVHDAR